MINSGTLLQDEYQIKQHTEYIIKNTTAKLK